MVLIVYGVSGSGKRSCCNFLAAESHVTLQDIDIFDASTYSLPTQHYQSIFSGKFASTKRRFGECVVFYAHFSLCKFPFLRILFILHDPFPHVFAHA